MNMLVDTSFKYARLFHDWKLNGAFTKDFHCHFNDFCSAAIRINVKGNGTYPGQKICKTQVRRWNHICGFIAVWMIVLGVDMYTDIHKIVSHQPFGHIHPKMKNGVDQC